DSSSTEESDSGTKQQAVISRIRRYVERDYARATLQRAAAIVQKNPQYVSRLFKQVTGTNFNEYLSRVRMEKAAQLITDVDYLTYQVSEIVGYSNPKNFTRTFRKHFGVSPRDFRRGSSAGGEQATRGGPEEGS
ncbi:MAG TPA: helix-turn-helix domain-containing protein, partial [Spirochaetia bacterium]|nr:helix-turn-helix domain-containing protein [Spirochaetia bacterium]